MAYQGRQPGVGVRNRFIYSATNGQTSFSGADSNGLTLAYADATYVDVFLNGTLLVPVTDYAATTKTSVVLGSGAAASDIVEIVAYDISSIANAVPISGGTMTGGLTVQGTVAATAYTGDGSNLTGVGSPSIDDNGNATAITINSSESVLVGKSVDTLATSGTALFANGQIDSSVDGNYVAKFNRKTSDGTIIELRKDTTGIVGSIGVVDGDNLFIGSSASDHGGFYFNNTTVKPYVNGVVNDGAMNIGASAERFKDIFISGGIHLGGTASANKLDDYEEGTWTPSNASVTISINDTAKYTKVGNLVTVTFYITFPNISSGASCEIFGLPFVGSKYATGTGNSNSSAGGIVIRSNLNGSSISVMGTSNNNISVGTLAGKILIGTISYETSQ